MAPFIGIGNSIVKGNLKTWSRYWAGLISATVEQAAPTKIVMTFSQANTSLLASDFTIAGKTITLLERDVTNKILTLTVSVAVAYGDSLVVTFVKTGGTAAVTNNVIGIAEYFTVYEAFATKPNAAKNTIYNNMVKGLVDGGYWARMDGFYFHAAHINTGGEAHINWKLPGTFNSTAFNAPTFTIDQGILGNGTNQYIDYNWIPSVNGVNYIQDSASQILYIRTNVTSAGQHGIDAIEGTQVALIPKYTNSEAYIKTNDNTWITVANTDGSGLYFNTRTAAAVNKLYRNKTAIINGTTASTGVPTKKMFSLAFNQDGVAKGFRADQLAIAIYMDGCSQADVTAISDILNAAMTSLGTNIY